MVGRKVLTVIIQYLAPSHLLVVAVVVTSNKMGQMGVLVAAQAVNLGVRLVELETRHL